MNAVLYKKQQEGIFQFLGKIQYHFNYALLTLVNASINTIYSLQQRIF